jgi:sugar phosphate isomerase/epimerase
MQIGICADPATLATFPGPLSFDFIEGNVRDFLKPEAADAEFSFNAAALRNCPRSMPAGNHFLPDDLRVTGAVIDYPRLDHYAATAFRRAAEIGMTTLAVDGARARNVPPGFSTARAFEQFVDVLRHFAPTAAAHRVTLAVEPLAHGECNFINTLAEAAEVIERVAHPHVRLLVNISSMLRNGEAPDAIAQVGPLVHHLHVTAGHERPAPETQAEDLRPFFRPLKKSGFDGRMTIQAAWKKPGDQVRSAIDALRSQLISSGYR